MMMTISECQSEKDHKLAKPSSPACLSSCFSGSVHSGAVSEDDDETRVRTPRPPYAWLKATAAHELPEIRGRCRSLIARLGRSGCRRRRHSTDFSYDAYSYALNFEDDAYGRDDESFPFRSFAARLPATPKAAAKGVSGSGPVRREIVGFS